MDPRCEYITGTSRLSADRGRHFRQSYLAQLAQEQVRKIYKENIM